MRIFITTMDDPLYTNDFIKKIIDARRNDIVGLAVSKGTRLKLSKKKSKLDYLLALLWIMGPITFLTNSFNVASFKAKRKLSKLFPYIGSPSILEYAKRQGIDVYSIDSVNEKKFLEILREKKPEVIINQTQDFLKKSFLKIPTIGVINRHNALLPINRGRITPFWVLYKGEKKTGVSIHFVTEKLDAGDIIVQEKFTIEQSDDFNNIVKKNYEIAPAAMLKALNLLENGNYELIPNNNSKATYNTTPTFKEAREYRRRLKERRKRNG